MFNYTYYLPNFTNNQLVAYNGFYDAYFNKMMINKIYNQNYNFGHLISYAVSMDFKNFTNQYQLN